MRTLAIAKDSGAEAQVIINCFYAFGKLDRQLVEFLESEAVPVIAKVPRSVAFAQAAGDGVSVAVHSPYCHAIPAIEELADKVMSEKETRNEH